MSGACHLEELSWCGFPAYMLDNGLVRAIVVPRLGGKIASLINLRNGREWLWKNPHIEPRQPDFGDSYAADFDIGGWDECFPSVAATYYPSGPWEGIPIPDHGEIWSLPWKAKASATPDSIEIRTVSYGVRVPYRFERIIRLPRGDSRLHLGYSINNLSIFPMPFIWSPHPLFQVTPGMRLIVPVKEMIVYTSVDDRFGQLGTRHAWPSVVSVDGEGFDLSFFPQKDSGIALKLYGRSPSEGFIALVDPLLKTELRIEFNPIEVSHLGMWLNFDGWSGVGNAPHYYNVAIQPCIGAQDDLLLAYDHYKEYGLISPHGIRSWRLDISLR